jgi:hypothetical protein
MAEADGDRLLAPSGRRPESNQNDREKETKIALHFITPLF